MEKGKTMPRLIDADTLFRQIDSPYTEYPVIIQIRRAIKEMIDDAPTVDAEPVRHGRWKQSKHYPHIIICDECGEPYELSNSMEHWNYCPNCGAKMDLNEEKNG